jgi:hypothetical protein
MPQAPKRGAISRKVAGGDAPLTQVGECVLEPLSEVPCGENAWMLDAESA